jgi:hypothetical protein
MSKVSISVIIVYTLVMIIALAVPQFKICLQFVFGGVRPSSALPLALLLL